MDAEHPEDTQRPCADRRIASLAEIQHGVVSRTQLISAGLGRGAVAHRIEVGWLHRIHPAVYAVGHPRLSAEGMRMAAVLAYGPRAIVSHRTAAEHWGLLRSREGPLHVAVPRGRDVRSRPGIRVHRLTSLRPEEITALRDVPVTTPGRTLLDLVGTLPRRALVRAAEESERLGIFDPRAIENLLRAHRGRPGTAALTSILTDHSLGTTLTRSELEERFLALCEATGHPRPLVNSRVAGFEVDFLWRDQRLVVETDGHASHRTRAAFERDRARDAQLTLAGYRVVRFTYRQVVHEAGAVTATVTKLLGQSS